MTSRTPSPLRVGVMLDSTRVTAWEYKVLRDIAESDVAVLSLAVINDTPPEQLTRWQKLKRIWPNLFYSLYLKFDYRLTRRRVKYDAFAAADAGPLLESVAQLKVRPLRKKFTDRFSEQDVSIIRDANLDVMIRFGFRIIRGEILSVARYGVWSMHHGDNDEYRGGPAHFWEIYEGNPLTGVVLQVLSEDLDAGQVIYRSWGRTNPHSLFLNRNGTYWKAAEFYMRRLRQLHARGENFLQEISHGLASIRLYDRGIYRNPSNLTVLRFLAKVGRRWAAGWLRRQWTREAWFIAWRPAVAGEIGVSRGGFQLLDAPKDRYYADPFLVDADGKTWLFFEEYPYATGKGIISCVSLDHDGNNTGKVLPALERPYHLSFPFMMRDESGRLFMIPETRGNQCVEKFRCDEFPDRWTPLGAVLPDVSAADTVIFEHDGSWWLMTNIAVPGAAGDDELSLFYADALDEPWHPHPLNPIVSDVRRARMAGEVFKLNGVLIRPAQDGSRGYGSGVVFHEINILTRANYKEMPFETVSDAGIPGNIGTHTYNRNDKFEVIDGRFQRPKWR